MQSVLLLLHEIFLHCGMEKVYRTLLHTRGYVAQRLPDPFCWVCAQAKAQMRELRTHAPVALLAEADDTPGVLYCAYVLVTEAVEARVDVFDDDDHDDTSSDEGDAAKLEIRYLSPVAGRALGTIPVPRFNLDKLKPFQVMFVDNKDYEQPVGGGGAFLFIKARPAGRLSLPGPGAVLVKQLKTGSWSTSAWWPPNYSHLV